MKVSCTRHSVDCMINGEIPSSSTGFKIAPSSFKYCFRIFSVLFLPHRKTTTHTADTVWLIMVASAAPDTPMWKPKIRIGSSTILITAPINTVIIPIFAKPWQVINWFNPSATCTEMVPNR